MFTHKRSSRFTLSTAFFLVGAAICQPATSSIASELQGAIYLCKRATDQPTIISACSVVIGLTRDPNLLERAYNRRGMANEQINQFDSAASDYSKVIRLNPTIAGYFDNRMRAYKGAGRLELALRDANTAVQMAPTYAFTFHGRGSVYLEKGDYISALRDFTIALTISPGDVALHVDRGRALMKLERTDDALREFEAARAINPAFEPALRERGLAFAQLGRREQARADLAAAVAISPGDADAADALRKLDSNGNSDGGKEPPRAESAPPRSDDRTSSANSSSDQFTPPEGAPFCTDKDELQEYMLALIKKDKQWASQLTSCMFVKGGLKIAVIDAGDAYKGMHIDKVRIFNADASMVGYTLSIDKDGS